MRWTILLPLLLAGCASGLSPFARPEAEAPAPQAELAPLPEDGVRPQARPADGATPDGAAQAQASAAPAGALGTTVASLGSPAEPGLWLKTPLVSAQQPGRISYGGASAQVTLIPLDGPVTAGSRMSIAAFQALGAALTDLPEVTVFAG
ncbi:MAG: hypothetical protein AAGF60_05860 [Pseudomonadota bacterium]